MDLLIISVVAFCAATISALSGMGGGVLLFAMLAVLMPLQEAIALHAFTQVISNGTRVAVYRKDTDLSLLLPYAVGSIVGIVIVGYLWAQTQSSIFSIIAAVFLLSFVVFEKWVKKIRQSPIASDKRVFLPIGLLIGALSMIIGAIGPLLTPFLRIRYSDKAQFIGTKAVLQLSVQLTKTIVFASVLSFPFVSRSTELFALCVATILGTLLGRRFLDGIDDRVFDTLVRVMLTFAAIKLIWDAFSP